MIEETLDVLKAFERVKEQWLIDFLQKSGRVTCMPGCSHCCNLSVQISLGEALVIHRYSRAEDLSLCRKKYESVMGIFKNIISDQEYFSEYRARVGSCFWLDSRGFCKHYGYRPLSCRMLYSSMNPEYCKYDFLATCSEKTYQCFLNSLDPDLNEPGPFIRPVLKMGEYFEERIHDLANRRTGFDICGTMPVMVELVQNRGFMELVFAQPGEVSRIRNFLHHDMRLPELVVKVFEPE